MNITYKKLKLDEVTSKLLAIGCFEDKNNSFTKFFSGKLKDSITLAHKDKRFSGKKNETLLIDTQGNIKAAHIVLVGLGKKSELTIDRIRQAAGTLSSVCKGVKSSEISTNLIDFIPAKKSVTDTACATIEGLLLSAYTFNEYKTEKKNDEWSLKKISLVSEKKYTTKEISQGIFSGTKISEAVYLTRDLVSHPGNTATPSFIAEQAKKISSKCNIKCSVLNEAQIKKLNMGSFLGVSHGSCEPPKFIVMEYFGKNKKDAPHVLIGKGVTFDSGGISLKPSKGMEEMKFDMAGAATVIGAITAVASLKLPVNVVSLIPATENMPSGTATKPGDVLKSMSGKSIEVISTDAEGRLILADALTYAKKYKPQSVIDVATLTGACIVALGYIATAVLGNNEKLIADIKKASEESGERVWQLPLWDEYNDLIKSDIADMKNVGGGSAGTITAACFLKKFADKYKWAHLDIAGTAWEEKGNAYNPKGASGVGVRLLLQYLANCI